MPLGSSSAAPVISPGPNRRHSPALPPFLLLLNQFTRITKDAYSVAHRDIVVIGASLGGLETLPRLVAGLPGDLRAAVLIVQHVAADAPSFLAERLDAAGPRLPRNHDFRTASGIVFA